MGTAGVRQDRGHCPIDRLVHALEGIAHGLEQLRVMRRVTWIMDVPALVPHTVGFRENLNEQVPSPTPEDVNREIGLLGRRHLQPYHELLEVGGCLARAVTVEGIG